MSGADQRQQQELEEERRERTVEALRRVQAWTHNRDDILFLASELGVSNEFNNELRRVA